MHVRKLLDYYYKTVSSFDLGLPRMAKTLPVLRVRYEDAAQTWLYLTPSPGQILKVERQDRANRWGYYGLHGLDFAFLYRHRPLWDVIVVTLLIGVGVSTVTSLVPACRRLARHARRLVQPARARIATKVRIAAKVEAGVLVVLATATTAFGQTYTVRVVRDLPYLEGANYADDKDKLDLYLPEGRPNAPVIVSYYGNQLMGGDKSEDAYVGRRFASAGFVTAVVNYRLSPGVSHPAHIQDAAASFAWVKRHVAKYGGNPDKVFVVGYSAGGYLAALLSTDPRYLAAHNLRPRDIRGTVPVSAFYWVERRGVAPDRDKSVWGTSRDVWVDASPAHHLDAGAPPMLILYADGDEDWRRQQNVEVAAAMKAAGHARAEIAMIRDRNHATIWTSVGDEADETAERIIRFASRLN